MRVAESAREKKLGREAAGGCMAQASARLLHFSGCSGVVQSVARQPLELVILVRVQAPEPNLERLRNPLGNEIFHWDTYIMDM